MADTYSGGSALDAGSLDAAAAEAVADGGGFTWDGQTALQKMRAFIRAFDAGVLDRMSVDYTDQMPDNAGLFPSGLVEIRRRTDILGHVTVESQYNFALYTVLEKYGDAPDNAEWQMRFQEWVQEQSARGLAPAFGDDPRSERITAQNGQLYSAGDEGTALYAIQINATFTKRF